MKIKSFIFPTFEEWIRENKRVKIEVGAYCCKIGEFSRTSRSCKATYMFATSLANVEPFSMFTSRLYCKTFTYEGDVEKLKNWYYNTINEFNIFWENHIKSTYIEE